MVCFHHIVHCFSTLPAYLFFALISTKEHGVAFGISVAQTAAVLTLFFIIYAQLFVFVDEFISGLFPSGILILFLHFCELLIYFFRARFAVFIRYIRAILRFNKLFASLISFSSRDEIVLAIFPLLSCVA